MGRIFLLLGLFLIVSPVFGADFNIHVYTDNVPDYTDLDSYEFSATDLFATDQEKCIQIWKWASRTTHQMSRTAEKGRGIFDHVLQFNSYPNTFCGFYAAFNTTVWEHMGYKAQYVELGDHTVSQVSWDGGTSYHLFDSSMRMYCLKHDGVVASCQDIMDANTCSLSEGLGAAAAEPGHFYLYHFAKECGTNPVDPIGHPNLTDPWGYRGAVDNPVPNARTLRNGADSYTGGFTPSQYSTQSRRGFKYSLDLHPYQVYTKYFLERGDTEDYYRTTSGSFNGDPNDSSNFVNMRGNGHWEFDPDLSTTAYRKIIFSENATIHRTENGDSGPQIRPAAAAASAEIFFKVNSANVTTSAAIHI
jgi:hypothetical protein